MGSNRSDEYFSAFLYFNKVYLKPADRVKTACTFDKVHPDLMQDMY
jgi:hypothetical protein